MAVRVLTVLGALLLVLADASGGGAAAAPMRAETTGSFGPHPRILLDPVTLQRLRAAAKAGSQEWKALKGLCDALLTGTVSWPDGNDYPDSNSVGEGYQGDGYLPAAIAIGLCYQTAKGLPGGGKSAQYAAKGLDLLTKMTAPSGPHAAEVGRDSGYGIRNYVPAISLLYDWLYPKVSASLRGRVYAAVHRWIAWYQANGFEHGFPQGNYFAGYYNAKALAALATAGDSAQGTADWNDWRKRVQGQLVQPYYAANLSGGGWPEGWNYGPFATWNMSVPTLAVLSATGIKLTASSARPFTYPLNAPRFLLHFTWPDLKTMEDSDFLYDGDNPSPTQPYLVTMESALLAKLGSSFAPYFHSYTRAVKALQPDDEFGAHWDAAVNFLFWNPEAPEKSYTSLPRSYYAQGLEMASVRSSWEKSAVWAEFKSGPYTNYTENGEELFDQGSLAIVNGTTPFLVNAWGALVRNTPGTSDGSPLWQKCYDDVLSDNSPRDLFNTFYVDSPQPEGQGQHYRSDGTRTAISTFSDAGSYVVMRGTHLEDAYPRQDGQAKTISAWTRDVVYLRPNVFVVHDHTTVTNGSINQWLNWHFSGTPTSLGSGSYRFPGGFAQPVLPAARTQKLVDVFSADKVYRLEIHASDNATTRDWITVFVAGSTNQPATPLAVSGGVGVTVAGQSVKFFGNGAISVG